MPTRRKHYDRILKSPPSENEGRIMAAEGGRRYLVQEGRRIWIDPPPPDRKP